VAAEDERGAGQVTKRSNRARLTDVATRPPTSAITTSSRGPVGADQLVGHVRPVRAIA